MSKKKSRKKSPSNRTMAVFLSLAAAVSFTVLLLFLLAPQPLKGVQGIPAYALDAGSVFKTDVALLDRRWKYIYIHHSRTLSGDLQSLARQSSDHFVIGNGDGADDGEVQITATWTQQQSINTPPEGVSRMDPSCISICLVGDFDQTAPTSLQEKQLSQLVNVLRQRLNIPVKNILMYNKSASPAGIGQQFPLRMFRDQLNAD